MAGIFRALGDLLRGSRPEPPSPARLEALRAGYRARCESFRRLLAANNAALDIMASMEEALRGQKPFGMTFVRGQCARVAANVFQIVRQLSILADGRYDALFERLKAIQAAVAPHLESRSGGSGGPLVLPLAETGVHLADEVGGKMSSLGEIVRRLGRRIPPGFAVTASGYRRFMEASDLQAEIDRRIQTADASRLDELFALSSALQKLILAAPLPGDLERAILEAYRNLETQAGEGVRVALRSSAVGEDALGASFAGQYQSELNVPADEILETYKEIVASKYGLTAMTYRLTRGIPDEDVAMCVGCMAMVGAEAGGVAYSRDPLDIRGGAVVVNAVHGLPKAVVDGSFDPDVFLVERGEPMRLARAEVADKPTKYVCDPAQGIALVDVPPGEAGAPSLSEAQVLEVAALAADMEEFYGLPQDIEFALAPDGGIVLLQSRPLHESGRREEAAPPDTRLPVLLSGGTTAAPGVGCGPAFAVRKDADALRFPDGAVLVAAQAHPRWAPLLSRAAAVVCEAGSAAGHLANVAREYGVPALLGVAGALEALDGAGEVTVDADNRRVHPGRAEELLALRPAPRNLMEGSPVHAALAGACAHIVPLNLIDPDAPDFTPEHCRTLHDVTRFCHEKSVREMFLEGEQAGLEGFSKQLTCGKSKLKYWVIDLEDGFDGPVEGRFVDIARIASGPMRALWRGMTAVPWAGPPAADARGFLAVVAGAASNPELEPTVASAFTVKNYFMISKEFCNLQSRFGFHFCTVEAQAGDDPQENYVSFQFKGGAADLPRRRSRALLVAGLLEERDFRVEVREDALFARLEGLDQAATLDRVAVLGYVVIHTRQLDMAMGNEAVIGPLREKMEKDIAGLSG
ncbi:PEP-utilizing enzyme [Desulfovibrio aminophilus]|nr:PEP/pyruvate-binding domain-containing protein [Desulfovibrio aminophilus]MCM0755352.1 PEP-utilizing enzyme [Desulfovibrio aminophilus]